MLGMLEKSEKRKRGACGGRGGKGRREAEGRRIGGWEGEGEMGGRGKREKGGGER